MLELRILNGYHRGATLPLDGESLSIGGAEDADVVLADPGLVPDHARLRPHDGAWLLEPHDGPVRGQFDNLERDQLVLGEGGFARVGPIWITVCDGADPWQDPPPEPADSVFAGADDEPQGADGGDAVFDGPGPEDDLMAPPLASPAPVEPVRRARGPRIVLIPLTAMIVLTGAAAYALTTEPDGARLAGAAAESVEVPRLAAPPQKLAPEALRQALRKRLAEIDLLERVTLELGERQWLIRAALGADESERLQRMLSEFERRHALDIPVHLRIGSAESMLPFRIAQVMSGDDACIITDDGRRLYVGDEYRGVRLAAVAGNRLRFSGRQNLDIAW